MTWTDLMRHWRGTEDAAPPEWPPVPPMAVTPPSEVPRDPLPLPGALAGNWPAPTSSAASARPPLPTRSPRPFPPATSHIARTSASLPLLGPERQTDTDFPPPLRHY